MSEACEGKKLVGLRLQQTFGVADLVESAFGESFAEYFMDSIY